MSSGGYGPASTKGGGRASPYGEIVESSETSAEPSAAAFAFPARNDLHNTSAESPQMEQMLQMQNTMGSMDPEKMAQMQQMMMMTMFKMMQERMASGTLPGGVVTSRCWVCSCGFKNNAENEICGGTTPMGCHSMVRPDESDTSSWETVQVPRSLFNTPREKWTHGSKWKCTKCGFLNKPTNMICGGTGAMGCKSPSPSGGWLCSCGWANKPNNIVCGGGIGRMGCKLPRPVVEEQDEAQRQQELLQQQLFMPGMPGVASIDVNSQVPGMQAAAQAAAAAYGLAPASSYMPGMQTSWFSPS